MSRADGMRLLMTPENIRLSREGKKTQTRRIIKLSTDVEWTYKGTVDGQLLFEHYNPEGLIDGLCFRKPRYRVGDLCYLPEPWAADKQYDNYKPSEIPELSFMFYGDERLVNKCGCKRPARFMCRWMARHRVRITKVLDPHRIQMISEEDLKKEMDYAAYLDWKEEICNIAPPGSHISSFRETFVDQWESIHGPGAWVRNDWVLPIVYEWVEW